MMWGYGYGGWPGMLMMGLGTLFWFAVLVVAIWALVRWLNRSAPATSRRDDAAPREEPTALEILRQRYARGEIDAATFEEMRARLDDPSGRERMPHAVG